MKVLLLAAGYGTRLRPLTNVTPKCLMPIGGRPLLDLWLERLIAAGHGPFLINTHHLHKEVENHIEKSQYRDKVTLAYESELSGTAGTILENVDFFGEETGIVLHADNFCLADLRPFEQAHNRRPSRCCMTMMAFRARDPSACGVIEIDDEGVAVNFHEKVKTPPGDLANAAIYIFSRDFFREIKQNFQNATELTTEVFPYFKDRIFTYEISEPLIDIGTLENYAEAQKFDIDNIAADVFRPAQ